MTIHREIHHDLPEQSSAIVETTQVTIVTVEEKTEEPCYAVDPHAKQHRTSARHTRIHQATHDRQSYACLQD